MPDKKQRVKLSRLLLLFVLVNAGIAAVGLLAMVFLLTLPTLKAFGWHIRNGNKFVIEGHTLHLPLRWNCTLESYKEWELSEDHPFSKGESSILISEAGMVRDLAAIKKHQAPILAGSNTLAPGTMRAIVLHGRRMDFECVTGPHGDLLLCDVPDSDISVTAMSTSGDSAEMRAILETSE